MTILDDILHAPKSKTLEFKRDLSSPKPLLKSLVAFANTAGGKLLIAIDDDKKIVGVDQPLDEEERLSSLIKERGPENGVYVRLGSSNRQLDEKALLTLRIVTKEQDRLVPTHFVFSTLIFMNCKADCDATTRYRYTLIASRVTQEG